LLAATIAVSLSLTATAQPPVRPASASPPRSDADIRRILVERVDTHRQAVGIVVGLIDASGRRIVTYGSGAKGDARPLDGDSVFEIGSITKVFTSLLLAAAVERKEVAMTDPIQRYLPSGVKAPERGRPITLLDLATQTSGLPRMPDNFAPKDASNPYADYSSERLYEFLTSYRLTRDPGEQYEYSNVGVGLLGHLLAQRAGMSYEALVKARVTEPLGMSSTGMTLSPAMQARLVRGHDRSLQPAKNWDLDALAGAGGLRSTANDMLTFLSAVLGYTPSPLAPAIAATLAPRRPAGPGMEIALGWHVVSGKGKGIIWHNGGTGGYRTFMGFDPEARAGVVVLANASTPAGPDDIGRHLLDPDSPLLAAGSPALAQPRERTAITIANEAFDRYVGRYQLAPAALITISRNGDRFLVQLTGQPAFDIFAESERAFFLKAVDAQITFETDAQGKPVALILHQNGVNQRAPRIEGEPIVPKVITLDVKVLETYVGRYDFTPGISLTITRQDTRLFAQLTGQGAAEIFASAPREFFYKIVNAQLTFEVDAEGRATAVVLHQAGRDQRATRN
jgi:CubicO group peptidase (beta-lactamase class C family)